MIVTIEPHPLLDASVFETVFPGPLSEIAATQEIQRLLAQGATAPLCSDESVRGAIRDLLRHGGYKPTGRGKPASEYLLRTATEGAIGSINAAVDACNAVSLHSGLPISVVDLDLVRGALRIGVAPKGASYVFNASGQVIDLGGLLCLFDAEGPCANGVKDSQRTKTHPGTRRTMSVVWGSKSLGDRSARAEAWYRALLAEAGATTEPAERIFSS